jgi:hypothetical protein
MAVSCGRCVIIRTGFSYNRHCFYRALPCFLFTAWLAGAVFLYWYWHKIKTGMGSFTDPERVNKVIFCQLFYERALVFKLSDT